MIITIRAAMTSIKTTLIVMNAAATPSYVPGHVMRFWQHGFSVRREQLHGGAEI